jgi:putative tryptophan/tyrosine transport system substrate-binding protein
MRRRDFILLFGSVAAAWPLASRAQEAGRTCRIGGMSASPLSQPYWVAVFDELRRAGYVEGQNLIVDWRPYSSHVELIPAFAAELAQSKPDVIVAVGDAAIRAAQNVTKTIPILGSTDDMVASGLINSLARPEGNTTGTSIFAAELDGKRQELLLEVVPGLHNIAALADSRTTSTSRLSSLKEAADARNVRAIHSFYRETGGDFGGPGAGSSFGRRSS